MSKPKEYYKIFIHELLLTQDIRQILPKNQVTPTIEFGLRGKMMIFEFVQRNPFSFKADGTIDAYESFYKLKEIK